MAAYPGVVKLAPSGTDTISQLVSYVSPVPVAPPDDMIV